MSSFGIQFPKDSKGGIDLPVGFYISEVHLGNYKETCFSDCSVWSPDDYILHWKHSANFLVRDNLPQLFCSSLESPNVALWVGVPKGDIVIFYNQFSKLAKLTLDGLIISPKTSFGKFFGKPSSEWSSWTVLLSDLKNFVETPEFDRDSHAHIS